MCDRDMRQNKFYKLHDIAAPDFLDQHQRAGLVWLMSRSHSYLAHSAGAGKTAQAIVGSLLTKEEGQTVFIVPPSLTVNWSREIEKFCDMMNYLWPSISIIPTTNKKFKMDWSADFIICPDSMLTRKWVLKKLFQMKKKFIAIDEASRFKEDKSMRTVALFGGKLKDFKSPGLIYHSKHVVLLDGSPMPNRPMELWAPTFAMAPDAIDYKSKEDFGFRYCGPTLNDYGYEFKHSSNEEELRQKLQKSFMHVVTEDKLRHPERLRSILYMDRDVRLVRHKAWEAKFLQNTNIADIKEEMSRGELASHRQEIGMRKIPWIAEYVTERLTRNPNEPILLFAWHREVCEGLMKELAEFNPGLVMGGTPNDEREKCFESFQAGRRKLIIGNIGAMGRGHNLQAARRCIFGEYSWSDETNKQCEKRASRRGNAALSIRSEYIVCPGLDEIVLRSAFTKEKRVKRIIG